jgi:hypothetical protein
MRAELARLFDELVAGRDVADCAWRLDDTIKDLPAFEREAAIELFVDLVGELT